MKPNIGAFSPLIKQRRVSRTPQDLLQQVAQLDSLSPNPTASEYTLKNSRRSSTNRTDGQLCFDPNQGQP